jgi:hypothetical protein
MEQHHGKGPGGFAGIAVCNDLEDDERRHEEAG